MTKTEVCPVFGYVLALAARTNRGLTVLDYGGNLGDYYWLAEALVPDVELDYHCKELPRSPRLVARFLRRDLAHRRCLPRRGT